MPGRAAAACACCYYSSWIIIFTLIFFVLWQLSIPMLSGTFYTVSVGARIACSHQSYASSTICQAFVPSSTAAGRDGGNMLQETASAILDRLTQDAQKTATITPIDMKSIRLAVDDMVILLESHDYQSGDVLVRQLKDLTRLISNAALSMAAVRTKVDIGVDRVLAKSALLLSRSMSRTGSNEAMSASNRCAEGETCTLLIPSSPDGTLSYIQQTSALFATILAEFSPLTEKAKSDALAMEECLRSIQVMLVQEKIIVSKENDRLAFSIMAYLGAHRTTLAELDRRESSINTLLSARRDILSYMFATSDLLDQLSSDIREMQELAASALNPAAQWEDDFFAVISAGSQRMRLNKMMQRNALDVDDQTTTSAVVTNSLDAVL